MFDLVSSRRTGNLLPLRTLCCRVKASRACWKLQLRRAAHTHVVTRAVRKGKYKVRKDGSIRKFGGVNVLMYGDFWQLKPVDGAWLCCNPLDIPGSGKLLLWVRSFEGKATTPYGIVGNWTNFCDAKIRGTTNFFSNVDKASSLQTCIPFCTASPRWQQQILIALATTMLSMTSC